MQNNQSKKKNLGGRIKKLSKEGLSYRQIEKKLQCSKSTIAYHLSTEQRNKAKARLKKQRTNDIRYEKNRWQYLAKYK
tara:strand:+ start:379 stop:612 length:234 start_codon:yes stop_codon:yes gene_type:complete